jgi:hypothetical protein
MGYSPKSEKKTGVNSFRCIGLMGEMCIGFPEYAQKAAGPVPGSRRGGGNWSSQEGSVLSTDSSAFAITGIFFIEDVSSSSSEYT